MDYYIRPLIHSIEAWTEEMCGLQIKNATIQDSGLWRLTSINSNTKETARGIAYINVQSILMSTFQRAQ